jgi:hypothetical protein
MPEPTFSVRITFGAVDASALILNLQTTQSIGDLSSAEVVLKLDAAFDQPIDLFSEVKITAVRENGTEEDLFTGTVLEAIPDEGAIRMSLQAGTSLTERNVPPSWSHAVTAAEWIYTIVRESGIPHERTSIQGLDEVGEEAMLVVVPISGIDLEEPVTVGPVTFVPNGEAVSPYGGRGVPDFVYQPLTETPVHAVYQTTARLLRDAEAEGLEAVDVVLGYLLLTGRYGLLFRPNGAPLHFDRQRARVSPRRGSVVAVEALVSGRCWVRVPEDRTPPLDLALKQRGVLRLLGTLALAERQALISWRRAASEQDPVAAATALSDALEFYASGVASDPLFEDEEIDALLKSVPELAPHKTKVVRDTIKRLNSAPLKSRVIEAARRDHAPLTKAEVDFLWRRIRRARNSAVHGKGDVPPTLQELELALSVVARLLACRIENPAGPGAS